MGKAKGREHNWAQRIHRTVRLRALADHPQRLGRGHADRAGLHLSGSPEQNGGRQQWRARTWVESTPETVRSGYLDPAAKPVAVIAPGGHGPVPRYLDALSNEAKFGMSLADREPLRHRYPHGPYSMLGPVPSLAGG